MLGFQIGFFFSMISLLTSSWNVQNMF